MQTKTKVAIVIVIFVWSSAYVGIRAGLQGYSPEGLALLRYLIASACMGLVYFRLPNRTMMKTLDMCALLAVGAVGIGIYNIALNNGELTVSSGVTSFIVSQSPIMTALVGILFLGERLSVMRTMGFFISVIGVALIAVGETGSFQWSMGLIYVLLATLASSFYSLLQKPFMKRYNAIEATTYLIWGGTLFLAIFMPKLQHDIVHASWQTTATVVYLGIFPAAIGYLAWSYILKEISVTQAASFLYYTPFVATLLGWLWLGEVPLMTSILGGLLAISGVWFVNRSYKTN